jgi:hypothetical protein
MLESSCQHGNEAFDSIKGWKFLAGWMTVSFSRWAILHEVRLVILPLSLRGHRAYILFALRSYYLSPVLVFLKVPSVSWLQIYFGCFSTNNCSYITVFSTCVCVVCYCVDCVGTNILSPSLRMNPYSIKTQKINIDTFTVVRTTNLPLMSFDSVYEKCIDSVRFQVLTTVSIKIRAFWDVLPCSLVGVDQHFGSVYCLHHQPWWWRQYSPLKHQSTTRLHGTTSQKTNLYR